MTNFQFSINFSAFGGSAVGGQCFNDQFSNRFGHLDIGSFIGLPCSERGVFYYWGHWDLVIGHSP